jgi:hypothetical protein
MSCPLTPARGSYFCEGYINHTPMFSFKVSKSTEVLMDVKMIKEKKSLQALILLKFMIVL